MPELVLLILIFLAAGLTVLAGNLILGRLVRPDKPSAEKGEVYECGEQPIGSAWVQFDLRFYVVALLFVIFDVELAFFFPWAVVFGSAIRAGDESLDSAERVRAELVLQPQPEVDWKTGRRMTKEEIQTAQSNAKAHLTSPPDSRTMRKLAWISFVDILVFFSVLLVGFAYLWRRGDLKWIRSLASQSNA